MLINDWDQEIFILFIIDLRGKVNKSIDFARDLEIVVNYIMYSLYYRFVNIRQLFSDIFINHIILPYSVQWESNVFSSIFIFKIPRSPKKNLF